MRSLHMDCSFGLGGDMFLAAMADLGLDLSGLVQAFAGAGMDVAVSAPVARRNGLAGRRLEIEAPGVQPMRHLPQIEAVIRGLPVSEAVRERSLAAFSRLAGVEAAAHGIDPGRVHFHEVGAVDTLIDVVGAFWGLGELGVKRVTCGVLPWFTGHVDCAHGRLPLPAPAVLKLLEGKPVRSTGIQVEILTPTGALIVDQGVDEFVDGPTGVVMGSGTGWGTLDPGPDYAGLRLVLVDEAEPGRV